MREEANMAIINCPECGQPISDHAEHCIHCGTKFTVCPVCGQVFAGTAARCPLCGAEIADKREEVPEPASPPAERPPKDPFKEWRKGSAKEIAWYKMADNFHRVMDIASGILFLVGLFFIFIWRPSVEDLLSSESWRGKIVICKAFISIGAIVGLVSMLVDILYTHRRSPAYYDWLVRRYGEPAERIKALLAQARTDDDMNPYSDFINELFRAGVKGARTILAIQKLIGACCVIVFEITLMACMLNIAEPIIVNRLTGLPYSFDWSMLIVPGIIFGVLIVAVFICIVPETIIQMRWFRQIAPEDFKRIYESDK